VSATRGGDPRACRHPDAPRLNLIHTNNCSKQALARVPGPFGVPFDGSGSFPVSVSKLTPLHDMEKVIRALFPPHMVPGLMLMAADAYRAEWGAHGSKSK
jgi:hypothetical protein